MTRILWRHVQTPVVYTLRHDRTVHQDLDGRAIRVDLAGAERDGDSYIPLRGSPLKIFGFVSLLFSMSGY